MGLGPEKPELGLMGRSAMDGVGPGKIVDVEAQGGQLLGPLRVIISMVHGGVQVQSTRNSSTSPAKAEAHSSSIRSVKGQAGVVKVMVMMQRPRWSISIPYTRPRSMTSMPSSGSMTW